MSATAEETDLVQLLQRTFPSLASLPLDEGLRRAEGLGLYTATVWSAGTAGLASRGIAIAPDVHAALSPAAAQIAKEKKGGAAFLARVRASVQEETFAATLV
ncbi:hypothetical protein HY251_19560, partial [bacterium]|nr:hypothetical protein [bacterium]